MRVKFVIFLTVIGFFYSCGGSGNVKSDNSIQILKDKIKLKEESLGKSQNKDKSFSTIDHNELIALLLDFSTKFPKDPYAPVCLDKIHMAYSAIGLYSKASEYADLLLKKYPKYVNRAMILESQASNYDIFIQPRDTSKVRYYNEVLLKENPNMSKERKEDIQMKLKHLDLNLEEYLDFIMKQANGK